MNIWQIVLHGLYTYLKESDKTWFYSNCSYYPHTQHYTNAIFCISYLYHNHDILPRYPHRTDHKMSPKQTSRFLPKQISPCRPGRHLIPELKPSYVLASLCFVVTGVTINHGEGAISLNVGVINPRSHSIRRHAQFVHGTVHRVNKQSRRHRQPLFTSSVVSEYSLQSC